MQAIAARCGVSEYTWRWLPADPEAAYASIQDAPELVQLLAGAGVPLNELEAPVRSLCGTAPALAERVLPELRWGTATGVYNAVHALSEVLPEAALCMMYRAQFPLASIAELLMAAVDKPLPEVSEPPAPVLLGRQERVRGI
jgi:hypothetical protein